ncbi:MAG: (Fe-S)-binding protein [Elusimicrobiota bacterium]|jgi:epoxyqueuosine reductase QueG|nr:(Fe-S)-binding protein [Elusimicrobiota bacterium]
MKNKIINEIKNFVLNDKQNWFDMTNDRFFDEPIIRFASSDNALFIDYKTIIGNEHLTPKQAYETEFGKDTFQNGTVISVVLPLNEKIRKSNRKQKDFPSKEWVLNRSFGDGILIDKTGKYIEQLLSDMGYKAVSPYAADWFKTFKTPAGPSSIWSERHIAYAAGLGTFSLNDGFISEKGIAVRLISAVTNLILEPDKQESNNYHANCLFFSKNKCGVCISRCPVNAISENGHDKIKCWQYVYGEESRNIALSYGGDPKSGSGCGLCQTNVPCEYKVPIN